MACRREMPLAPAMDHIRASSFSTRRAAITGAASSKTQAFLCFQITHVPNITRVLNPFLSSTWTMDEEADHHSSKPSSHG
jgi:hypothetical protein